jgi:hypothetical protein
LELIGTDLEIIAIYKRRWDIEQGYKELREHFGFGQEDEVPLEGRIESMKHLLQE